MRWGGGPAPATGLIAFWIAARELGLGPAIPIHRLYEQETPALVRPRILRRGIMAQTPPAPTRVSTRRVRGCCSGPVGTAQGPDLPQAQVYTRLHVHAKRYPPGCVPGAIAVKARPLPNLRSGLPVMKPGGRSWQAVSKRLDG
jgi:hypothetical protein